MIKTPFSLSNGLVVCNGNPEDVPERPTSRPASVIQKMVDGDISCFLTYLGEDESRVSEVRDDLAKAFEYSLSDGYDMCKYLENHCDWDGSSELVDLCEEFITKCYHVAREQVRSWVATHGIRLAVPVGTRVKLKRWPGGKLVEGTIVNDYPGHGEMIVSIDGANNVPVGQVGSHGVVFSYENPEVFL